MFEPSHSNEKEKAGVYRGAVRRTKEHRVLCLMLETYNRKPRSKDPADQYKRGILPWGYQLDR